MDDGKKNAPDADSPSTEASFAETVGVKAAKKLRAKRREGQSAWWGLGMMGTIGWSVAIPTLIGVLLGRWLDSADPGGRSWTLALLAAGLVAGCMNAWHWVGKESRKSREMEEDER